MDNSKNVGVYRVVFVFTKVKKSKVDIKTIDDLVIADTYKESLYISGCNKSESISKLVINGYSLSHSNSFKIRSRDITELWECSDSEEPIDEKYTELEQKEGNYLPQNNHLKQ